MAGRPERHSQARMRHRCTVQTPTVAQDDSGQPVVTWVDWLENEPCQFMPSGGSETMRGRQQEANVRAVFRVRYRSGYTPQMRIMHDGEYYGITFIDQVDGLRRYLEIASVNT